MRRLPANLLLVLALRSTSAWCDDSIQLSQRLHLAPGANASAAVPAGLTGAAVTSSAADVATADVVGADVVITARRAGKADVTFTANGLKDLLAGMGGNAPAAAAADAGYAVRETIAVDVSPSARPPDAAQPAAGPAQTLQFQRAITLSPGGTVRVQLPTAVRNVTARSSAPGVQASIDKGVLVLAAKSDATGAASVKLHGDGPLSLLDFGRAGTDGGKLPTRYRFDEALAVTVAMQSAATTAATAASPPEPIAADPTGAARKGPSNSPAGKGSDGKKKPDDPKKADDAPAPRTSSTTLTLRMGDTSTAALPAHARAQSAISSDTHVAKVAYDADQVTVTAVKPGNADVTVDGDMVQFDTDFGANVAFKQVVHVTVKGPDLSGRWINSDGRAYTIAHNGATVLLYDGLAHPWQGTLNGRTLQLSHVYSSEDVGRMNTPDRWPLDVQQQLVGKTRRINATVKGDGDDATISGTLHGIEPRFTKTKHQLTLAKDDPKPLQLTRSP